MKLHENDINLYINFFSLSFRKMRYPPAPEEWIIQPEDEFTTFQLVTDLALTAEVLVQVSRSARLEGCFKIQLGGDESVKAEFPANNAVIMGGASLYKLVMERLPREIDIKVNTTTSAWFDLEDR